MPSLEEFRTRGRSLRAALLDTAVTVGRACEPIYGPKLDLTCTPQRPSTLVRM